MKVTQKKSDSCQSNQVSAVAMIYASDKKLRNFNCFSVQGTGGSPMGPDPENGMGDRDTGSPSGKYSFVNRTIQHWNQLPAEVLGILPCKPITFKKRVRKAIIELN